MNVKQELIRLKGLLDISRGNYYNSLRVDEMEPFEIRESPIPDYCFNQSIFLLEHKKGDIHGKFINLRTRNSLVLILQSSIEKEDLKENVENMLNTIERYSKSPPVFRIHNFSWAKDYNRAFINIRNKCSSRNISRLYESWERDFKLEDISVEYVFVPFSSFNAWNLNSNRYELVE
ncbi:MAG: hypothetical protein ACOCUU_02670 [Nanoarchaeota archaeon]